MPYVLISALFSKRSLNTPSRFVTGIYYNGIVKSCPKRSKMTKTSTGAFDFTGKIIVPIDVALMNG